MSTDIVPDSRNRLAQILGILFHPFIVSIPTVFIILNDLAFTEVIIWLLVVLSIFLLPLVTVILYLRRHGRHAYQRTTRTPIYIVGLISILFCLIILIILDAPQLLTICVVTLLVWLLLQLLINTLITKVSTHVAVVSGCGIALWILGKLITPHLQILVISIILATAWARVASKNHTIFQVGLGFLVGAGVVLVVFPLFL